mgnify:CR=1 FL=1
MELNLPKLEQKILNFWHRNKIFQKSISQRKGSPFFNFYDGPPFATGKPHYGHILATTIKDTILRYWTMKGYQVPRRVGWDCHGLPVENLIEKELGIKNKKEIEEFGIEKFNQACRNSVFRCVEDFEKTLKRIGRWADYRNSYATLDSKYIETIWWVLGQLWQAGLVYKDYRVNPYCPRCGTSLSNFEVNQGYKDVKDPSVFVKFEIKSSEFKTPTYFLVWTTTPWTLPSNVALAIDPRAQYLLISQGSENYILAKTRIEIIKGKYSVIKNFLGKELLSLRYQPLFNSLVQQKIKNIENAFQVLPADFVSLKEGTGIVHTAVMYGEEDFQLGKRFNLPMYHAIDQAGLFKPEISEFAGQFVKNADPKIIQNLIEKGFIYQAGEVLHSYPFCWRCDSPLIYYAIDSWYIAVTKLKKNLVLNNKKIRWVPEYMKEGRFGKWLEEARDWNFSRNRFWGAPIPIWFCSQIRTTKNQEPKTQDVKQCENTKVVASIKELEKLSKAKLPEDLHRPYIDKVTFKCDKCGGIMKRVLEVFDCWFESGSMPYGQWHYPFENKKLVEKTFPADFVAEGLDQTRGWFYTLHVLAAALTLKKGSLGQSKPAFKNVIVNGLILDSQGKKLSKKLKNYPEPKEILNLYGADSLRYFLLTSTPMGEDYRFSSQGVKEVWRKIPSTILHSYIFFQTYLDKNFKPKKDFQAKALLDKWIISRTQELAQEVIEWMDKYEITKAARFFNDFVEDISNWYIRRSRRYFQKPKDKEEKEEVSQALYLVLKNLSKISAPFLPFLSEYIYQNLKLKKEPESVHLCDFSKPNKKLIDDKLTKTMRELREIVSLVLAKRAEAKIKVRQPLALLTLQISSSKFPKELLELIKEEVNVKKITFGKILKLDTKITVELKEEGMIREFIRQVQGMRKKSGLKPKNRIIIQYSTQGKLKKTIEKYQNYILEETEANNISFKEKIRFKKEEKLHLDGEELWIAIQRA